MSAKHCCGFRELGENELGRLTFLGASGEVTGSSYLLETGGARVLFDWMCQGEEILKVEEEPARVAGQLLGLLERTKSAEVAA